MKKKKLINFAMALGTIVLMYIYFNLSPYVMGYLMLWFPMSKAMAVGILTTYLWTVIYWFTFWHSKCVVRIFSVE